MHAVFSAIAGVTLSSMQMTDDQGNGLGKVVLRVSIPFGNLAHQVHVSKVSINGAPCYQCNIS